MQDVSVGGEDFRSEAAPVAVAVAVQGIALVREVPPLAASANSYAVPANTTATIVGASPQRRMITIVASAAGVIAPSKDLADAGVGLPVPANVPIPIGSASEIYWRSTTLATVGFWAELDRG